MFIKIILDSPVAWYVISEKGFTYGHVEALANRKFIIYIYNQTFLMLYKMFTVTL